MIIAIFISKHANARLSYHSFNIFRLDHNLFLEYIILTEGSKSWIFINITLGETEMKSQMTLGHSQENELCSKKAVTECSKGKKSKAPSSLTDYEITPRITRRMKKLIS